MIAASILPNVSHSRQTPASAAGLEGDKLLPVWNLSQLVERYSTLAGGFGQPLPLLNFSLTDEEITLLFNAFDEDYHISRYLHFSNLNGKTYQVGGEAVTHLSIDESIKEIL